MSTRFSPEKENSLVILRFLQRAVQLGDADFFAGAQGAVEDARDRQAPEVVAVVQIGHQNLQRAGGSPSGGGMCLTMASNSGRRSSPPPLMSVDAVPVLALV